MNPYLKIDYGYIKYNIKIETKLTIVSDLSATGKTTLINILKGSMGANTPIKVESNIDYSIIDDNTWNLDKKLKNNRLYLLDEDFSYRNTKDFLNMIKKTNSYFLVIGREPSLNINYSTDSIYRFKYENGVNILNKKYKIDEINYKNRTNTIKNSLNEDSKSGYEFFNNILALNNFSSHGNKGIISKIKNLNDCLIILDRVAYGRWINVLINYIESSKVNAILALQKSFEHTLIESGVLETDKEEFKIQENEMRLKETSLEKFYHYFLAIESNKIKETRYSKKYINKWYLKEENIQKIVKAFKSDTGVDLEEFFDKKNQLESKDSLSLFKWD